MEQIFESTLIAQTGSYPGKPTEYIVRCAVCGRRGIFGTEIVDADYVDSTGRDSVRLECHDAHYCMDRQRTRWNK